MKRLAPALLAVLALAAPGSAQAGTGSVENGRLNYVAERDELNRVAISLTESGDAIEIHEFNDGPSPTAGAGCAKANATQLRCPVAGITRIALALGDDDDLLEIGPLDVPLVAAGGSGRDTVNYPQNRGFTVGIHLTADNVADDGPAARDDIADDFEIVYGSVFADTLTIGPGGGQVFGHAGDDRMNGGAGDDVITAAYVETVGTDSGAFYQEGTDTIACGPGGDTVWADRTDSIASDCEVVAKPSPGGFRIVGSQSADRASVECGWEPAALYGRGGGDLLIGSRCGPTNVYGGTGNDRIDGGGGYSYGGDRLEGGSGNDRIRSRDRGPRGDRVICGPGRDTAIVDRRDVVSGCERVLRG